MHIRKATADDATAVSDLIRPLAEEYIACEFSPQGARTLLASMQPEAIEGYINSAFAYYVAEMDGVLAGVVAVRDNSHLYHLFVAKPFQGQGLARRLWNVARDACYEAGNTGEFTVNSSQFAVGMYRKFGFIQSAPPQSKGGVTFIPMRLVDRIDHTT